MLLTLSTNSLAIILYFKPRSVFIVLIVLAAIIIQLAVNIVPCRDRNPVRRLRSLRRGHELILLFSASFMLDTAANIFFGIVLVPDIMKWWVLVVNIAVCLIFELILLLNGLFRVFITSLQLGIKWRVLVFFFWWVPGVNIFLLRKISRLLRDEYDFETTKNELDDQRADSEVCRTRYPLVLVHGVFSGTSDTLITGVGYRRRLKEMVRYFISAGSSRRRP
jgi:triacylglycerol lipase